jgi:hypothetical protein
LLDADAQLDAPPNATDASAAVIARHRRSIRSPAIGASSTPSS